MNVGLEPDWLQNPVYSVQLGGLSLRRAIFDWAQLVYELNRVHIGSLTVSPAVFLSFYDAENDI